MYLVHNMNQIHHFFNIPKKLNLLIIMAGGSIIISNATDIFFEQEKCN
jgi:hypothetical protein